MDVALRSPGSTRSAGPSWTLLGPLQIHQRCRLISPEHVNCQVHCHGSMSVADGGSNVVKRCLSSLLFLLSLSSVTYILSLSGVGVEDGWK